jgi:hypothetical protein
VMLKRQENSHLQKTLEQWRHGELPVVPTPHDESKSPT